MAAFNYTNYPIKSGKTVNALAFIGQFRKTNGDTAIPKKYRLLCGNLKAFLYF